jgi:hypothetical protein
LQAADLAQVVFAPMPQGPPGETAVQEFLVLPGKGTPRWLLPARHQKTDSVLASWSAYRWSSQMKWADIRTAQRAGCLSSLPGVAGVNIDGIEGIDWRSVGWSSNVSPVPVVYVGTPGANRKAVIHLVHPESGTCDAVAKVPLAEAAQAAILREADVLTMLADEDYTCAPRLLYVDRDRGVTTQTALNGKAGGRKFTAGHRALLRSLMLADETTTIVGHALEWQEQLLVAVGGESDIRIMTAALSELWEAHRLPACWVHGDFAPWNIRHLPDGSVALLDWEDAQRSGLPLQDALHFLHMQDYLFGARPAAHSSDLESFAKASGISPEQCGKLEIAYLAHTYSQRSARREVEHSEYLLDTLRVVLQGRHQLPTNAKNFTIKPTAEFGQIATSSHSTRIRADLFAAVIAQLNLAEIPYCVLTGYANNLEKVASDVDFMFHPRDMDRIAPLLAQAAQGAGARLVQSIQHETSACYFVVAKDDGSEVGYLDPDCASDYRKRGRLWLSAEKVLAGRRWCKDFYVPAVPDEFTYYLIKKVLKQSLAEFQLRRLRHLYQRDSVNCRAEISKFWSLATVRAVERALVVSDLSWFEAAMPSLLSELKASDPVESLGRRVLQKIYEAMRVMRRALHPTGMAILVCGGERKQRSELAEGLVQQLAPAFRRTAKVQLDLTGNIDSTISFRLAVEILVARLSSTFVVSDVGNGKLFAHSLCPGTKWFASLLARLLFRPDVIFVLTADDGQTFASAANDVNSISTARKGRVIFLNSGLSQEENSQQASRAILLWLATRQKKLLSPARRRPVESNSALLPENLPEAMGLHLVE